MDQRPVPRTDHHARRHTTPPRSGTGHRRPGPVLRIASAAELLALVPYRLGFQPRDSVVLLSLRGARREIGLIARVDVHDLGGPDGELVARSLLGRLVQDDARGLVLAVYVQDDTSYAAALHVLLAVMEPVFGPVQTWVVGPRGYFEHGCTDVACCPDGGRSLEELRSTVVGAHMVVQGRVVAADRSDLVRLPRVAATERSKALRASGRSLRARTPDPVGWRQRSRAAWFAELHRATEAVWVPGGPALYGRLLAGLADVTLRDAVVLFAAGVAPCRDDRDPDVLAQIFEPGRSAPPDRDRVQALERVVGQVAAHAGPKRWAPALTVLATVAWWAGDGARCAVLLERALDADPDHRLARLLRQVLSAGLGPGWTREEPTEGAAREPA